LIRTILRKACHEWEWIERIPKVSVYREKEGRIRSLTPAEFAKLLQHLPPPWQTWRPSLSQLVYGKATCAG
jgi:hypothetical protein